MYMYIENYLSSQIASILRKQTLQKNSYKHIEIPSKNAHKERNFQYEYKCSS